MNIITKIKKILLKAASGFLCAFFPLYIAQYLSHEYFNFPLNFIVGIILLVPFFFLAVFIWKTINTYFLFETYSSLNKELEQTEKQILKDYGIELDENGREILENLSQDEIFDIEQRYNMVTRSEICFSRPNPDSNVQFQYRQTQFEEDKIGNSETARYLMDSTYDCLCSPSVEKVIKEYRVLTDRVNKYRDVKTQITRDIEYYTLYLVHLKKDYLNLSGKIVDSADRMKDLENSQEAFEHLKTIINLKACNEMEKFNQFSSKF